MTDSNDYDRLIKKAFYILPGAEILSMYKIFVFNERINEKHALKYNLSDKISENDFKIYPDIPKKLSFFRMMKFRKAIKNFITYQYSKNANTFVERKILKEAKSDVYYIFRKQQIPYLIVGFLAMFITRSPFIILPCLSIYCLDIPGEAMLLFNLNDLLMKYQINKFYRLGRETNDFINYLNNYKNSDNIVFQEKNKNYYDKFFVKNIMDVKFEKEDNIVDYLQVETTLNFHKNILDLRQQEFYKNYQKLSPKNNKI
jgi:hypothetical protein